MASTKAAPLLTLPAELRNRIFEHVLHHSDEPKGYIYFSEAIQQAPKLLYKCQRLRNELWPMYFSNMKLVVNVSTQEIQRFQGFLRAADERLIATLQNLSLTLPCNGCPEFGHLHRCVQVHSVLYGIELSESRQFEMTEYHGFWFRESGQLTFGEVMNRIDSFGYSTCTNWTTLPVRVEDWEGGRFRKGGLLALIDRLCAHERVAPRLVSSSGGSEQESSE